MSFFNYLSDEFIKSRPPISTNLDDYGNDFPQFIKNFAPLQNHQYLYDIALFEKFNFELLQSARQESASNLQINKNYRIKNAVRTIKSKYATDKIINLAKNPNISEQININSSNCYILLIKNNYIAEYQIIDKDLYEFINLNYNKNILLTKKHLKMLTNNKITDLITHVPDIS